MAMHLVRPAPYFYLVCGGWLLLPLLPRVLLATLPLCGMFLLIAACGGPAVLCAQRTLPCASGTGTVVSGSKLCGIPGDECLEYHLLSTLPTYAGSKLTGSAVLGTREGA